MKKMFFSVEPLQSCSLSVVSLFLRLIAGGAMLSHGIAKIMNFATLSQTFSDPLGVGSMASLSMNIGAEVGCSLLLIVGLFTRFAILPLVFAMSVASFVVLCSAPFSAKELSLLYIVIYVAIFALGAGRFSVDNLISKSCKCGK